MSGKVQWQAITRQKSKGSVNERKANIPRDALDTTAASQTADGGLGNALDVVAQHLAVTLRAALAQTLATFATTRHDYK